VYARPPRSWKHLANQRNDSDSISPDIWKIVAVATLGPFLSTLDATVVNVSLSSLATELHSTLSVIQWVASGYLLSLALMLPLSGWLVDRVGARKLYICCFSAFTVASALCGLAWSADSLIGFRVLQGMAGGLLAPMAQMMVARAAGARHMVRVMGYAALPILVGPLLGPVIAGAILQHSSWRWLFYINVPVGVLAVVLSILFLPGDETEISPRRLDFVGFLLLSPGLVAFMYGFDHLKDPTSPYTLGVAVVLIGLFLVRAKKMGPRALMNLSLFQGKTFSAAAITQFLANGVSLSFQVLVPLYLVQGCHVSPQKTGYLLAPLSIGMMCTYPLVGKYANRFGIRKVSAGGALLTALATVPFLYMGRYGLFTLTLLVTLFVRGIGQGAIGIPSMSAAYSAVSRKDLPMATTTLNILQRLGGPIMTTAVTIVIEWKASDGARFFEFPFSAAFLFLLAMQVLLFFSSLRLPLRIEHGHDVNLDVGQETFEAVAD
jgi:EmrB/QacA subfamily drug resistance transporter